MTPMSHTAVYNVKAVVRETGLTPDILRAWERRYGVPRPQRSPGGHRLYSQRDIDLLKWLVARKREGLSISHAVELWGEMSEHGLASAPSRAVPAQPSEPASASPSALREAWVGRCLAFDQHGADAVLSQGFGMYAPETVVSEIMQDGLIAVDDLWYNGMASVQQVYFASQVGTLRLDALLAASPSPTRMARVLLGCPPEEQHTFGVLVLALLLRWKGWDVLYLGANLPLERLEQTLADTRPDLVVLSAQQLFTAGTLMVMAEATAGAGVPVAYGGRIFNLAPDSRRRILGHFLGERLADAPFNIESVLLDAHAASPPDLPSAPYRQGLVHYRRRQPLIEAEMREKESGLPGHRYADAGVYLARSIDGALSLGDIRLLDGELDWLQGLLTHYHVPIAAVRQYLILYHDAARTHLGPPGRLVLDWLTEAIDRLA